MSLPPPGLPPEVGLRTRFKAVAVELSDQQEPALQAALLFELGALTELRLGDAGKALEYYRDAESRSPSFRPALFASARLLQDAHDYEALLKVLAKLQRASTDPHDSAGVLVEIGCLLEDQLGDAAGARDAFERALAADPQCLTASIMRERTLLAQNRKSESSALLARRAGHTFEPKLRAALAVEAARELAADGELDAAIETLLTALALQGGQVSTLLCLAELTLRHGRPGVAGRAYEDLAALLAGFAHGEAGPDALEIALRFRDRASAARAAAFYYHTAARLRAEDPAQALDALRAQERAALCAPDDVLLGLALASAYQARDSLEGAQRVLHKLRENADPRGTAALSFELAEIAERRGDGAAALSYLQAAHAAATEAPTICAVLEDRLLDGDDMSGLCELLSQRARGQIDAERRVLLWRAALAAERAEPIERALALWSELAGSCEGAERTAALREWHGLCARAGDTAQLQTAAEQLLDCPISKAERSALWRSRYEATLAERNLPGARTMLELALAEPACDDWAGHAAWIVGGLQHDLQLLARAHDKLAAKAEEHDDRQLAAAHLTARGRALLACDAHVEALAALRHAVEIAPSNAYTRGLIERCLIAGGSATDAALNLLQKADGGHGDKYVEQAALLHAANQAEAVGDLELARTTYDQAVAHDPSAFDVQWARLRFAERSRDEPRRLLSLTALAEREKTQGRPGRAHLELGEVLAARGEFSAAAASLTAAIENETVAFEAAASAVLLPRGEAADALRPRAFSELAEQSSRQPRRAFEHERFAELLHQARPDADKLFSDGEPADAAQALARFLLQAGPQRTAALEDARVLTGTPELQAEFALHAARCRALEPKYDDDDALMAALTLREDAPDTLPSALALCEALDAADDPDTRVLALQAWLARLPQDEALDVSAALARALTDAGAPGHALSLLSELQQLLPDDPSLWESVRVAARAAGDYPAVVIACDALARHAAFPTRAELLEEAAAILHERLEEHAEAEQRLRMVLAHAPSRKPAFERLHDVLVEREDLDGLLTLLAQRIELSDSDSERVELLYERARILRARGDRAAALSTTTELLGREPSHAGALGLSAEIHATEENWEAAVSTLRRLAESDLTPAQRRLAIEGSADFLEDKLGDRAAAYRELEKLLALDLADFAVHMRMAKLAEQAELFQDAAQCSVRAAAVSRGAQRAHLERRAAALYDQVGDQASANAALRRALLAHPDDEQAFTQLYARLPEAGERGPLLGNFVEAVFHSLANEPTEPDSLRTLVRTGRAALRPVLVQLGLFALEALGQATREELTEAHALRAALPTCPRQRLTDTDFGSLLPSELTPQVLVLGQSASRAAFELWPDTPERHGDDHRLRAAGAELEPLRATLEQAAGVFGLTVSDLYVTDAHKDALYPLRSESSAQSWVVGRDLPNPLPRRILLSATPWFAKSRAHLLGLAGSDAKQVQRTLRLLLVAAEVQQDPELAAEAESLASKLSRAARTGLAAAAARLTLPDEAEQRLPAASASLGLRAALVFSGDLIAALTLLTSIAQPSVRAACTSPAGLELLRFWLSPACAELLERLGVCA